MNNNSYQIAQFNFARAKAPLTDPIMQGFVTNLRRINELADKSPGFVWRLQTEAGDATAIRAYPDDDSLLITLSVWETIESVLKFTYAGEHAQLMRERALWFHHIEETYLVLWWVPAGIIPTVEDGKGRLAYLLHNGPTPLAFTFKKQFSPEEALDYEVREGLILTDT